VNPRAGWSAAPLPAAAAGVPLTFATGVTPAPAACARPVAENKAVLYLAFDSAKWDMADVMVVGTLMTYIGLNGILKSELTEIEFHTKSLNTTTANFTTLQPGYFIFVGYVVFAFILGYILNRIRPRDTYKGGEFPEPVEGLPKP
jgi:hypothetical protein